MAVNAVMQKHSSLPGTPVPINVNQSNQHQQPILISRASDGSLTPTITGSHNTGYITVGGNNGSGMQTLISSGGQIIQGAPLTLSQLQGAELSQASGE